MKTLGRVLIILAAFALIMGIAYMTVNAVSASGNAPALQRRGEGFPQPEGARPPGGEGRGGGSILRLTFGFVKNVGIVAIIVALVVWFKDFLEKRRRTAHQVAR
jgi:hypothetical protein